MSTRSLLSTWIAAGATLLAANRPALAQGDAQPTAAPLPFSAPAAYDLGAAKHLKILYAGVPGSPRAKSFMEFLQANFEKVELQDVERLTKESAAPFDVVVCDGKRLYPMDDQHPSIDQAKCALPPDFTKPIVMIASMGGTVQHHTKIGWL
jgi:hypothetical protein